MKDWNSVAVGKKFLVTVENQEYQKEMMFVGMEGSDVTFKYVFMVSDNGEEVKGSSL